MTTEQFIQARLEAERLDEDATFESIAALEASLRDAFNCPRPAPKRQGVLLSVCCGARPWADIVHTVTDEDGNPMATGRCGKCGDGTSFEPEQD